MRLYWFWRIIQTNAEQKKHQRGHTLRNGEMLRICIMGVFIGCTCASLFLTPVRKYRKNREFTCLFHGPNSSLFAYWVLRRSKQTPGIIREGPVYECSSRLCLPLPVRDMTVFRPTHSGRCTVQINIGHFGSHGQAMWPSLLHNNKCWLIRRSSYL